MSIAEEVVVLTFREFLKREPESESLVKHYAESAMSAADLIRRIVALDEYKNLVCIARINAYLCEANPAIDIDVSKNELKLLMARVKDGWRKLGESEPYWSVLTSEKYRAGNITERAKSEFFDSGLSSAKLIDTYEARSKVSANKGTCFELGCGVGRVTYHLAKRFEKVIAVDISPGNLALCKSNLEVRGIRNVEYILIESLEDYESVSQFDFLYSIIVLQHNPPPVQKYILDVLTRKINVGGGCLFQTPATLPRYSFDIAKYLTTVEPLMGMHAIPMATVLELLQVNGLNIRQVEMVPFTGTMGSYLYFAVKPS